MVGQRTNVFVHNYSSAAANDSPKQIWKTSPQAERVCTAIDYFFLSRSTSCCLLWNEFADVVIGSSWYDNYFAAQAINHGVHTIDVLKRVSLFTCQETVLQGWLLGTFDSTNKPLESLNTKTDLPKPQICWQYRVWTTASIWNEGDPEIDHCLDIVLKHVPDVPLNWATAAGSEYIWDNFTLFKSWDISFLSNLREHF